MTLRLPLHRAAWSHRRIATALAWLAMVALSSGCTAATCPAGTREVNGQCNKLSAVVGPQAGTVADGGDAASSDGKPPPVSPSEPTAPDAPSEPTPPDAGEGGDGPAQAGSPSPAAPVPQRPDCEAGQLRCDASGSRVEVCTVAGVWQPREQCSSTCADGVCSGDCTPGASRCAPGQRREVCDGTGTWIEDGTCPFACDQGECTGECQPSATQCGGEDGLTPRTCDELGRWVDGEPCPNLCSNGSCGGVCRPGERRCSGTGAPELCDAAGTWAPQPACPFLCSGEGLCTGECVPGSRMCEAGAPRVCDDQGTWQTRRPCPYVCLGEGECGGECKPGETACSGQTPRTCGSDGRWRDGDACVNSVCDRDSGTCQGNCSPGAARCAPNGTRQECTASGAWTNARVCPFVCTGPGECTGVCKPGQKTCSGVVAQTCRSDASGFDEVTCMPAQPGETATCSAGRCGSSCEANPGRCAGSQKCWALQYGCDECVEPYVWRNITDSDRVCVTQSARSQMLQENAEGPNYVTTDPNLVMMFGPDACVVGYVWRDAFPGDHVCVLGDARTRVANENAAHFSNTRVGRDP